MRTIVANGSDWGREAAPRRGNRNGPPTDLYPCKPFGSNDYVYIMVVTTRMWDTLCAALDRPDLAIDPRFITGEDRLEHADELHAEIARWTRERTKYEAMQQLGAAGVPVSATLDTRDLFTDPHLRSRDFIQTVQHPIAGSLDLMRWPPRMSASEVPIVAAPLLGQHTDEVLRGELGLGDAELAALAASGAVAGAAVPA